MPFVVFIEPLYSGYISFLLLLIVGIPIKVNRFRLYAYLLYAFGVLLNFYAIDYNIKMTEYITPLFIPLAFFVTDFHKVKYNYFFSGVTFGFLIVAISLLYIAFDQNIFNNIISSFVTDRKWGTDNLFFGNGTALVMSLVSFYYLVRKNYFISSVINTVAILTTSRIPIVMYVFIILYIFFDKKVSFKYKLVGLLLALGLFIVILQLVSSDLALYNRLIKSDDREMIFNYSYPLFLDNWLLGFGPVDIPLANHLHNSLFEVLFRYGIVSFIPYLILIFKNNFKFNSDYLILFTVVLFFSFTQINLHNINYVIILSMIIVYLKNGNDNENID